MLGNADASKNAAGELGLWGRREGRGHKCSECGVDNISIYDIIVAMLVKEMGFGEHTNIAKADMRMLNSLIVFSLLDLRSNRCWQVFDSSQ